MTTLKPNGMAVIIGGIMPENIGRQVTTVYHMGAVTSHVTGDTHDCWQIIVPPDRPLLGYRPNGLLGLRSSGPVPSAWLMPIDDADPDWTEIGATDFEGGAA